MFCHKKANKENHIFIDFSKELIKRQFYSLIGLKLKNLSKEIHK